MNQPTKAASFWNRFCDRMAVHADGVPLFEADEGLCVRIHEVGAKRKRFLLKRSPQMEALVISAVDDLISDYDTGRHDYDGLIYIMFRRGMQGRVRPLYVGKTETFGKSGGNLSANIRNLATQKTKFARWGDGYQYHVGDLSAVALNHPKERWTAKYREWAKALFVECPTTPPKAPRLKEQIFFWAKPWRKTELGPWEEFGPTRLTFLEYLLIGLASTAFPEILLNKEGQNRD